MSLEKCGNTNKFMYLTGITTSTISMQHGSISLSSHSLQTLKQTTLNFVISPLTGMKEWKINAPYKQKLNGK